MNTDALIELDDLLASALAVQDEVGLVAATEQLKHIEPCLAGYVENEITLMAGRLALAGGTPNIVNDLTQRMMSVILIVFHAQRTAGVRLWQNAFPDTPLATLTQITAAKKPTPENDTHS